MERADAPGGGLGRRLCLERQDLSEPHEGRVCDHRHPLGWTQILWVVRQTVEGICTMNARSTKVVRCAIYTRVSTDQGPGGPCCGPNTMTVASQAATPIGPPCSGSWRTCGPAGSTSSWSTRSTA